MKNTIAITVYVDSELKKKFEHFFKQRGMSLENGLDFVIRDFLEKYEVKNLYDRMDNFKLSPRESEIAKMIIEGYQFKEIAAKLFISVHTVRNHSRSIYKKCGVQTKIELFYKLFTGA
jgi:DNA-binding NarL/FixJ family response regulator